MKIWQNAPTIIYDFLMYLKNSKGKSDNTVSEYFFDLRTFFRYFKIKDELLDNKKKQKKININDISIDFVDIDVIKSVETKDIMNYMNYLAEDKQNGPSSRSRKTSSLRSFFKFLGKNIKLIEVNPTENVGLPKKKKTIPKFLSFEESQKLLTCVKQSAHANTLRDYCILVFFLNCGMRLSELADINLDDIRDDGYIKITGKGDKERIVYLNKACIDSYNNYLSERIIAYGKDKNALFTSRNHRRISIKTIQNFMKRYFLFCGFSDRGFSVHKLRHTAATLMYRHAGVDIKVLKEILGHENISTTEIYTHTSDEQLKNAIESNPLSKQKNQN